MLNIQESISSVTWSINTFECEAVINIYFSFTRFQAGRQVACELAEGCPLSY